MRGYRDTNRRNERAVTVFGEYAGCDNIVVAASQLKFDNAAARAPPEVTGDAMLLARSPHIDVIVDVTGSVEYGAHVALEAFKHGKDVVLMNAELDATIGPTFRPMLTGTAWSSQDVRATSRECR